MSTGEVITTAHLREQIERRTKATFYFVNVGDEMLEQQVAGHFYQFPPGVEVEIGPRHEYQRGRKGAILKDEPLIIEEGGDPVTISAKLLEFGGHKGLALCYRGQEDDEIKKQARRGYIDWRLSVALSTQRKWLDTCAQATRDPGSLPPVQTPRIKKEIAWLRRYQGGLVDRKAYVVRTDGSEFDTFQEAQDYVLGAYPGEVAKVDGNVRMLIIDTKQAIAKATEAASSTEPMAPPIPVEAIAPAAPAPPKKDEAEDGDVTFVMRMAKTLGVVLTPAEYEVMVLRDKDQIGKIIERLASVRNMKQSGKPSRAEKKDKEAE